MFVIHAKIPIDPDRRDEALDVVDDVVTASNTEEGIIEYRAATDVQDENVIRLFEQYEDADAHATHRETDHYQEFAERLPEVAAGDVEVREFEVESASTRTV